MEQNIICCICNTSEKNQTSSDTAESFTEFLLYIIYGTISITECQLLSNAIMVNYAYGFQKFCAELSSFFQSQSLIEQGGHGGVYKFDNLYNCNQ